jgi:hypothetical protein
MERIVYIGGIKLIKEGITPSRTPILEIEWELVNIEKKGKNIKELAEICEDNLWDFSGNKNIIASFRDANLEKWVKELGIIIKYLKENNIPYNGKIIIFEGIIKGRMSLKEVSVILFYKENGKDITKEIMLNKLETKL